MAQLFKEIPQVQISFGMVRLYLHSIFITRDCLIQPALILKQKTQMNISVSIVRL